MADLPRIAVVGATGAVGRAVLEVLEQRKFPHSSLRLFASERSKGTPIGFGGKSIACEVAGPGVFEEIDIAFFDTPDDVARDWVPSAAREGAWIIDNSAAFRYGERSLVVVPEVNGESLTKRLHAPSTGTWEDKVLSNPNCSTAQLVVALKPLQEKYGLRRVVVSTYQSTSGGGQAAILELRNQSLAYLNRDPMKSDVFPHQIAFNCIPHIGGFDESGYSSEERKMVTESRMLLSEPELPITITAVRVPTFSCHAESVNIELGAKFDSVEEVRETLRAQVGLTVEDDLAAARYPMGETLQGDPTVGGAGRDEVWVGRVRKDPTLSSGLNLWVVSDNLRKGAALNAVQIGEHLVKELFN